MKFRDWIFWVHLVCGIVVGLVVMIMAVTGTILAFEPQIVEYAEQNVRKVEVPLNTQRLTLDEIVAKAADEKSGAKVNAVTIKSDPTASIFVSFGRDDAFYADPYTGRVLGGNSKMHEFMHDVEVWHRWLGMEGAFKPVGHNIKGVCNIAFFFMIVTGVYLWWPKNWKWPGIKNIIVFNPRATGKARDWNWHNVIGFWGAPLFILITVTGTIMSYKWANDLLYRMTGNEPPVVQQAEKPKEKSERGGREKEKKADAKEPERPAASLDALYTNAEPLVPGWVSMTFRLSGGPGSQGQGDKGKINVTVQEPEHRNLNPRAQITMDRSTGEVIKVETFAQQNLGRKLRIWVRYSHTGQAFGVIGQLILGLAAAGAAVLVWTGFAMAWQRFFPNKLKVSVKPNK
jgi:uncharacterized iron-regulated membrane protein